MSKLNIGVGEEFPLDDQPIQSGDHHACAHHWRHRRHRHGMHAAGAFIVLPAAAASITAAILYPLATLGVVGGLGLVAAAHRHGRWRRYHDEFHRRRDERPNAQERPGDTPPGGPREDA